MSESGIIPSDPFRRLPPTVWFAFCLGMDFLLPWALCDLMEQTQGDLITNPFVMAAACICFTHIVLLPPAMGDYLFRPKTLLQIACGFFVSFAGAVLACFTAVAVTLFSFGIIFFGFYAAGWVGGTVTLKVQKWLTYDPLLRSVTFPHFAFGISGLVASGVFCFTGWLMRDISELKLTILVSMLSGIPITTLWLKAIRQRIKMQNDGKPWG